MRFFGKPIEVTIPLLTEVGVLYPDLLTGSDVVDGVLVVRLDVRRRDWAAALGLDRGAKVRWEKVRTVAIQEISCLGLPIRYAVTIGDAVYWTSGGWRRHEGLDQHLPGIDLRRGVTTAALRIAVLLAVLGCVGLRAVSWLMKEVFHIEISKSSVDRWLDEAASHLPDAEAMARRLHAEKPITEGHFDELFPRGNTSGCVLVLKDEHGRIVATEEVEERNEATVVPFLERLKSWGLTFRAFYVDGCVAYRNAIASVFPDAAIQYDCFHVVQNIWRHLGKAMTRYRRALKRNAESATDPGAKQRLKDLAKRLWEKRGLLFKSESNMTDDERAELTALVESDAHAGRVRRILNGVWAIFRDSATEHDARAALQALKRKPPPGKLRQTFDKVTSFLDKRFDDMIAFLRVPGVRRNSLAESGMRCLRRLEQGHDGFRSPQTRDAYLRLYQAIRYLRWPVHRADGMLSLLGPPPRVGPTTDPAQTAPHQAAFAE